MSITCTPHLRRVIARAIDRAPVGSKRSGGIGALSSFLGSGYRIILRRTDGTPDNKLVLVGNGALPIGLNSTIRNVNIASTELIKTTDLDVGTYVLRISNAAGTEYIEGSAGRSGTDFILANDINAALGWSLGSLMITLPSSLETVGAPIAEKRWSPGHYLQATDAQNRDGIDTTKANIVVSNANFVGIQVSIWWGQTETTQGDYSALTTQMNAIRTWAQANNKKVWIRLFERSFHGETRPAPFPQYIRNTGEWYNLATVQPLGYGGSENIYVPKIWKPGFVRERFLLWCEKVAEYIAANSEFVMLSNEEWSFAGAWLLNDWSAANNDSLWVEFATRVLAKLGDAILHMNTGWDSVGGQSNAYYKSKLDTLLATGVQVIGPTDLRKDNNSDSAFLLTDYGRFLTNLPSASPPGYRGERAFCAQYEWPDYSSVDSPAEHLRWGVDELGLHFIAWDPDKTSGSGTSGDWTWSQALAAVNAANGRINTTAPAAIGRQIEYILAIGDSLTQGALPGDDPQYVSWRGAFQTLMTNAGRPFDMIGPQTTGNGGGSDVNHAAWGGASIDGAHGNTNNIADRLDTIFTSNVQPTTIILYLGWNDMWDTAAQASAATRFVTLFNGIRTRRPNAKVVVGSLHVPNDGSRRSGQISLNNAIRNLAVANPTVVRCADLDQLALVSGDYAVSDYLHFSTNGAQKVAQAFYNAMYAIPETTNTEVDRMVDHMRAKTFDLPGMTVSPEPGWSKGGYIVRGADLRSEAVPSWWGGNPRTDLSAFWSYLAPWYVIWDMPGHQRNLNTLCATERIILYALFDSGPWVKLVDQQPDWADPYNRNQNGSGTATRYELPDGAWAAIIDPTQNGIIHGGGGLANVSSPSTLRALHVRVQCRKRLINPAGTDDRHLARYACQAGADGYPIVDINMNNGLFHPAYYNPGIGASRFVEVGSTPTWAYFTTLTRPPTNDSDESYAYNSRRAISEAAFRANPPPPP